MLDKVTLLEKFKAFDDCWNPRIAGSLNGQLIKLVKCKGEFVWHHHEHEDEMFLVVDGVLRMELRDGTRLINPGEFIIIPRGVEHRPCADQITCVVLFEPDTTLNTGNKTDSEFTRQHLQNI